MDKGTFGDDFISFILESMILYLLYRDGNVDIETLRYLSNFPISEILGELGDGTGTRA